MLVNISCTVYDCAHEEWNQFHFGLSNKGSMEKLLLLRPPETLVLTICSTQFFSYDHTQTGVKSTHYSTYRHYRGLRKVGDWGL